VVWCCQVSEVLVNEGLRYPGATGEYCSGDGQCQVGEEAYRRASAAVGGCQYGVAAERGEQRRAGLADHLGGECADRRETIAARAALFGDVLWPGACTSRRTP